MHIPTRALVTACVLAAALLFAGCGGNGDGNTTAGESGGEVFLQAAAAQGPDPFTDSTAAVAVAPPQVTRTPQSTPENSPTAGYTEPAVRSVRVSGGSPGLYAGTRSAGSCDVGRQVSLLAADPTRTQAFARAAGVSRAAVPDFLHGLTSVVLRADTRVTDHGLRDGRTTTFQSVLQAGTAVLIDDRGVPRMRCACGNPLNAPTASRGTEPTRGQAWSGFRPGEVVQVMPAPGAITSVTLVNLADNTWIERRIGDNGHRDVVVRPPDGEVPDVGPSGAGTTGPDTGPDSPDASSGASGGTGPSDSPSGSGRSPEDSATGCATPTVTVPPAPDASDPGEALPSQTAVAAPQDCPTATVTSPPPDSEPPALPSDEGTVPGPGESDEGTLPDLPEESPGGGTVFDAPTDVFDS